MKQREPVLYSTARISLMLQGNALLAGTSFEDTKKVANHDSRLRAAARKLDDVQIESYKSTIEATLSAAEKTAPKAIVEDFKKNFGNMAADISTAVTMKKSIQDQIADIPSSQKKRKQEMMRKVASKELTQEKATVEFVHESIKNAEPLTKKAEGAVIFLNKVEEQLRTLLGNITKGANVTPTDDLKTLLNKKSEPVVTPTAPEKPQNR